MAKTKISEFNANPALNTDIDSINIAEGCSPSGINDAIRELMAQLKDFQTGAVGDSFNGPVGTTTAAAGAFTTLSASSTVTLSGGTANGVAYLNGSKVVTSGSALVFDGTNLGLGVTPSAWGSGYKAIQFPGGAVASFSTTSLDVYSNAYDSGAGSWKYVTSNFANRYAQSDGSHLFFTAPSGTAGNAISFSQSMTLDASGNLLIGATSAGYPAGGRVTAEINGSSSALLALRTGGTNRGYLYTQGTDMIAWSETGNFTVGTAASAFIQFQTSNTERARIDGSGNLLVGTTTANGKLTLQQSGSSDVIRANIGTGGSGYVVIGSGTTMGAAYFQTSSGFAGQITCSGTTTSYATSSDYRLKNTIAPMTGALAKVAALKPCTYKWKADGSDGEGFIAHELAEIVPQCVTGEKDAVDAEGNPKYQGIDTSFLVATLTAAIQEQQAIINQLKARLDAANL